LLVGLWQQHFGTIFEILPVWQKVIFAITGALEQAWDVEGNTCPNDRTTLAKISKTAKLLEIYFKFAISPDIMNEMRIY